MEIHFAPEEEVAPKLLLGEYNEKFVHDAQDLSCYAEEDGACIGGINAFRLDTLLMVDRLWVREDRRGKGVGARLLSAVEEKAQAGGAKYAELNTFGFQAPGFYERMGYRLLGALEPAVGKWGHYFYRKDLQAMEIEPAREKDIEDWMALADEVKDVFPGLVMEEHRAAALDFIAKDSALCARKAGRVVGGLLFSREESAICFLAVSQACRREHIGERLVSHMLARLDPDRDVTVTTYREGDPNGAAARSFYKSLHFEEGELAEEFGAPVQVFVLKRHGGGS